MMLHLHRGIIAGPDEAGYGDRLPKGARTRAGRSCTLA
ncbi:hypothetical protein BH24ACI4_BH24ACI4_30590 [soil metagenome]